MIEVKQVADYNEARLNTLHNRNLQKMAENIVESIIVKLGLDGSQYNREADKAVDKNQKLNKSVSETDKIVGNVTKTLARWFSVLSVATGVAKMIDEVQRLNDELSSLKRILACRQAQLKTGKALLAQWVDLLKA